MKPGWTLCFWLCLLGLGLARPQRREVSKHVCSWDDERPSNGLLLVTLGGTHSRPGDLEALHQVGLELGYQALALDYPNQVISTACRQSPETDAFERFRREIVTGEESSQLVNVSRADSIEARLTLALEELARVDTRWQAFRGPRWEKLVVAGHSQGSGHAAFLGKLHPLRGVLMLAGPQDHGASWLGRPGATRPQHYLGFLHRDDFFGCDQQLQAIADLRGDHQGVVVIQERVADAHMSVLQPRFAEHWKELLGAFRVRVEARTPFRKGWIEHLHDSLPELGQRNFLPSQRHKTPEVVECFGSDSPSSGHFLLHYAGRPLQPVPGPPVLLVPGAKVDATFYHPLAQALRLRGREVYSLTFSHNQDDNFVQAEQVAQALARIRRLSGSPQVDVVAHSKGCIVATVYATPGFRQPWMSPYAGDLRRLLLVGGPNGGLDYFHRHPNRDRGANNWPMVWRRWREEGVWQDGSRWLLRGDGFWPGQAQMVARWDHRFPVNDCLSYLGGKGEEFESDGIEAAIASGGNFIQKLSQTPLQGDIEVGLLAGSVADVPGFVNEDAGPSDGIILVESATQPPCGARVVLRRVLACNHLKLILGAEAQQVIDEFLR